MGGRLLREAFGGWQLAGIPSFWSGAAFDVVQKSSAIEASRVDLTGVSPVNSDWKKTLQYLNRAAFAHPEKLGIRRHDPAGQPGKECPERAGHVEPGLVAQQDLFYH